MIKKALLVMSCVLILGVCFLLAFQFTPEEIADREKWEDFLKTSEIVGEKQLGTGDSALAPWRLSLEKDGISGSAIWKNPEGEIRGFLEGWKLEIAAYRLDKYLKLNMVPPTVEREFQGNRGCCQLWVTAEMDMRKKTREKIQTPANKVFSMNRAIYLQRAFDNLIANHDRHGGTILLTKDWRTILIDHSRSFGTSEEFTTELIFTENDTEGPRIMRSLPMAFVESLKLLDVELMKEIVEIYLSDEEIEAVLIRRDLILDEIARLIEKYGEEN
ncbi:MAG: hypothetical protein MUP98_04035, partial [Candidatus Aminicenantes bacterium]|nr:hypothetical protein [Candidatus Aminicenantes bacterium]